MEVNTKCDVYSFQVVTSEIIMRKHTGDLSSLTSQSSSSSSALPGHQMPNGDVLDQCISPHLHIKLERSALACEDHILMLEFQSRISSKNETSFQHVLNCYQQRKFFFPLLHFLSACLLILLHCLPCCRFVTEVMALLCFCSCFNDSERTDLCLVKICNHCNRNSCKI